MLKKWELQPTRFYFFPQRSYQRLKNYSIFDFSAKISVGNRSNTESRFQAFVSLLQMAKQIAKFCPTDLLPLPLPFPPSYLRRCYFSSMISLERLQGQARPASKYFCKITLRLSDIFWNIFQLKILHPLWSESRKRFDNTPKEIIENEFRPIPYPNSQR